MRAASVLLALLLACSKRSDPRPQPALQVKDVTYISAVPIYEEDVLQACLETPVTLPGDAPRPEAPDGGVMQPCSAFAKKPLATCAMGWRTFYLYVVPDDDSTSRDCVMSGGKWTLDERELARVERAGHRKQIKKIVDHLAR